jgi:hypothetical protein
MVKVGTKSRKLLDRAFAEVLYKTPRIVKRTRRKFGKEAARKQTIAIAFSKARKAGARLPKP